MGPELCPKILKCEIWILEIVGNWTIWTCTCGKFYYGKPFTLGQTSIWGKFMVQRASEMQIGDEIGSGKNYFQSFKLHPPLIWIWNPRNLLGIWEWRGVRSDAQLSSTETRFQKYPQSGKNGSKHPMLSIFMAYNVISCKKIERNTKKIKIADFTM